jgi:chemotaxis signal transduction protein
MSVVVEQDGELHALLVDQVNEVMNLTGQRFENNVALLPPNWASFAAGIYRLPGRLMVALDVARLLA